VLLSLETDLSEAFCCPNCGFLKKLIWTSLFYLIPVISDSNSGEDIVFESEIPDKGGGPEIVFPLLKGHIFFEKKGISPAPL
jgi:hypothetical protein